MTRHKTHIDRDGMLSRFMKCLFIADHIRWPRGRTTRTAIWQKQLAYFHTVHWHFVLNLFLMTHYLHFSLLSLFNKVQAWNSKSQVSVRTTLKYTLNHQISKISVSYVEIAHCWGKNTVTLSRADQVNIKTSVLCSQMSNNLHDSLPVTNVTTTAVWCVFLLHLCW